MLIGAHVSVSDGLAEAARYAASVGCDCIQIFAKSPLRWQAKQLDPVELAAFPAVCAEYGIGAVFTHAAYLINLATTDEALRTRSVAALADEIVRGSLLGAAGVAVHLGTDPERKPEEAADRIASAISEAIALAGAHASGTRLLLENSAGAGTTYGRTISEIAAVLERVARKDLLGVCLDTCHAHASGIALADSADWDAVVAEIAESCGAGALGLIHANDCLSELGAHRDRHAWIGDGAMGSESFAAMMGTTGLKGVAIVVEMPGDAPLKDAENVRRLRALLAEV